MSNGQYIYCTIARPSWRSVTFAHLHNFGLMSNFWWVRSSSRKWWGSYSRFLNPVNLIQHLLPYQTDLTLQSWNLDMAEQLLATSLISSGVKICKKIRWFCIGDFTQPIAKKVRKLCSLACLGSSIPYLGALISCLGSLILYLGTSTSCWLSSRLRPLPS